MFHLSPTALIRVICAMFVLGGALEVCKALAK